MNEIYLFKVFLLVLPALIPFALFGAMAAAHNPARHPCVCPPPPPPRRDAGKP